VTSGCTCRVFVGLFVATSLWLGGCAEPNGTIEPQPGRIAAVVPPTADARAAVVRENPRAYLELVLEQARSLDDYTLIFTRHERRGLFRTLHGPERIRCWFRRDPFSVRMLWLDEDIKYGESTYVAGEYGNKVRFITRWWSPPLLPPPAINAVDLMTPIVFGESKRPMTDFGLERLLERTLKSMAEAGDNVTLTYEGLLTLEDGGPPVHHLHLEYRDTKHKAPLQELYIDVATDLPAGTIIKLPDGRIEDAYFYRDIDTSVELTDADFLLAPEREKLEQAAGDDADE
jgi:hypothetical protein